jgi:hypothetical protein
LFYLWAVNREFFKTELRSRIFESLVDRKAWEYAGCYPVGSWIIDLESASKGLGQRSELGRMKMGVLSTVQGFNWYHQNHEARFLPLPN